ncbi:unnamed protein product [Ranitomeya imitator]|uniref:RRM domain-containing protein n=1 Tax=Ranitomeya imitator TaxID=111125 RepID=A0ABN9L3G9_9NEOB|nr:unnamed protein product [Ranitomeya imitator]
MALPCDATLHSAPGMLDHPKGEGNVDVSSYCPNFPANSNAGTLEDWDVAVLKTESKLSRVSQQRAKAAEKQAVIDRQEEEKAEHRKKSRAEKKAKKPKKAKPGDKRKAEDEEDDDEEWGDEAAEQPSKKHKGEEQLEDNEAEEMETEIGLFGRSSSSSSRAESKQKPPAAKEQPRILHNPHKDNITVFVSNLPYNLSDPEQHLRKIFSGCGEISQVRVVYTNKGTFRGYCYVEFTEEKSALDALKMDRHDVKGRPMFVSPCVDKNKNPEFKVFKYRTSLEKHKLFVSGLPFSCTKVELEEIFKEHGTIKEIRLVTNRSGKPKDNDPKHTSRLCKGYLTKKESDGVLRQMTWPPQSPDLNPIEMVWGELDRRVKAKGPTSAKHLWELLQDCWKTIPGDYLLKLIKRMPRVCKAVIKAKGGYFEEPRI